MSIDRLIVCSCGHSVNVHEVSGCMTLLKLGPDFETCSCSLARADALNRIIDVEVALIEESWKNRRCPNATSPPNEHE